MDMAPDFGGTTLTLIDFALEALAATAQDVVMNAETTIDINNIVRIGRICMETPPCDTKRIDTHGGFCTHSLTMLFGYGRVKTSAQAGRSLGMKKDGSVPWDGPASRGIARH
jgi:hypothetical protein